ncbi:tripartite tricarboxylate transporter permease [Thermovirga sp.]|uniref:tripartite tricarboxylate transporter permease n=1 Tax=Thermovirga sp. TaxID=2699834 RepID=UPI0025EE3999|nr:tripartite tricarboxylate transporter permease [Thermovirga sp.]MBO8154044.1 tripartite tricarboxylate transporter permease [Thermovirga sp.]
METIFHNLSIGLDAALTLTNITWVFIGGLMGTIIGMLPGLGPATGVAILIPISYGMNPTTALITMAAIYYGAMFGGSRASIMINTPGDASAIVSCFDGYPMTKNGEAGKALAISAIASFIGGIIGMIFLIFLTMPVANAALKFGPAEMFSLMIFALTATVTLSQGNMLKGFIAMAFGFMLSTIGIDPPTGILRFTFVPELQDSIDFLVAMIGLYAVAEVFKNYGNLETHYSIDSKTIGRVWVPWEDFKKTIKPILRSSPLGFLIGVLPGMGGTVATFVSYALEKTLSKNPEKFGKGAIEGLAAPEAANNASSCGAFVPLLTLGIPGSGTTAVMLGALMMLGVRPGPILFQMHPEIAWGVIASMIIGNIMLVLINLPLAVPLVQLLKIPQRIMLPLILGMAFMGTYFLNYSSFDFILVSVFALAGYLFWKLEIPIPPLVLALILGGTTEQSFRNAMTISGNDVMFFLEKPISLTLLLLAALSVAFSLYKQKRAAAKS